MRIIRIASPDLDGLIKAAAFPAESPWEEGGCIDFANGLSAESDGVTFGARKASGAVADGQMRQRITVAVGHCRWKIRAVKCRTITKRKRLEN